MSLSHWVCEGIGIEQSDLTPLLDGDKLLKFLREVYEDNEITEEVLGEKFSDGTNDEKVEILFDDYVASEDYQLPELLMKKDDKNVLCWGSDNEERYFLLYAPRYPWQESGGFKSQEEVVQYICDLVRPYCRDDVAEKEILGIIDPDVYVYGCG